MNIGDATNSFNLFTHQQKRKQEGTEALILDYKNLREAVLELYLSVKIRSDEEIDDYNKDVFEKEKKELKDIDGYQLIDYIKSSIEVLMNMKMEEEEPSIQKGYRDIEEPDIDV